MSNVTGVITMVFVLVSHSERKKCCTGFSYSRTFLYRVVNPHLRMGFIVFALWCKVFLQTFIIHVF